MTRERLRAVLWVVCGLMFVTGGSYLSWFEFHDPAYSLAVVAGLAAMIVALKTLEQGLAIAILNK